MAFVQQIVFKSYGLITGPWNTSLTYIHKFGSMFVSHWTNISYIILIYQLVFKTQDKIYGVLLDIDLAPPRSMNPWNDSRLWNTGHVVRSVTKNEGTLFSFYFWFSYMSYIIGISIVKCWSWSLCNDLGSTFSIFTINFDRKKHKPKSPIWYDVVMLHTLHNN